MDNYVRTRLSIMMFLQFFVWGTWFVTAGNYMAGAGMASAIGSAYSVGPVAAILSPLFLGMAADRFFPTQRVLGVMHLLAGLAMLLTGFSTGLGSRFFIGALFLHTLFYMPTLGLANTLCFHHLSSQEKSFPLIRVFGTLGWIAAGWVVSKLLHADTSRLQFFLTGGVGIALGVFSFFLPHTPPPAAGKRVRFSELLGLGALSLLRQPSFAVFVLCSFFICIPLSAYYAFAPVFVSQSGFKDPGFIMSFGQMMEVLFMVIMPWFFARLGVKWMLLAGMAAWVLRYGLFSAAGDPSGAAHAMIIAGILLHGFCYDFFFVTGQIYVDKQAPENIRGQAQGFLVLVTLGAGMLIGAQTAGGLFNRITGGAGLPTPEQWQAYWLIPSAGAAAAMGLFALLFRDRKAIGKN